MEVLLENSRERFSSMDSCDANNNNNNNNNAINMNHQNKQRPFNHRRSSSVTSIGSYESNGNSRSRKTSVVQIKMRDETSDYHSEDEVFDNADHDDFRKTVKQLFMLFINIDIYIPEILLSVEVLSMRISLFFME